MKKNIRFTFFLKSTMKIVFVGFLVFFLLLSSTIQGFANADTTVPPVEQTTPTQKAFSNYMKNF